MIRVTGYGVIAEKPRVGKLGQIFPCTSRKNYVLDQKMNNTFYDGHDELYHRAKFGEDGAKMWCLSLCFVFFCLSRSESGHRAFEGCIVRISVALPFIARF